MLKGVAGGAVAREWAPDCYGPLVCTDPQPISLVEVVTRRAKPPTGCPSRQVLEEPHRAFELQSGAPVSARGR